MLLRWSDWPDAGWLQSEIPALVSHAASTVALRALIACSCWNYLLSNNGYVIGSAALLYTLSLQDTRLHTVNVLTEDLYFERPDLNFTLSETLCASAVTLRITHA